MREAFTGQISLCAGEFAPRGWQLCDGSLLPIVQHSALFAVIGTLYGGDGKTTFALPDLRGCAPLMFGRAPKLSKYVAGQKGGAAAVVLTEAQMAEHTHTAQASNHIGTVASPENAVWAASESGKQSLYQDQLWIPNDKQMSSQAIGQTGHGQPHNNMPPYLALSYIICLRGIFPPRKP